MVVADPLLAPVGLCPPARPAPLPAPAAAQIPRRLIPAASGEETDVASGQRQKRKHSNGRPYKGGEKSHEEWMRTEQPQLEAEPPDAEPCAHQPWRNRPFESRPQRFRPTSPPRQAVYPTLILVHGQAARRSQSAAEAGVYMWLRSFRGALFEVLDIVFEYSTFMYCNCTGASTCQSYGGGRCPGCALHRTEGPGCPRPADAHPGGGMVPCPVAPAPARPRASLRLSNETAA